MRAAFTSLPRALRVVFRQPAYYALALSITVFAFATMVWLPNAALLWTVFQSNAALSSKLSFAWLLLGGIGTNWSLVSAIATALVVFLFGINVAMIVYVLRTRTVGRASVSLVAGLGGVGSALLGVGCAACGSLVLLPLLSAIGAAGALAILPFDGAEFSLLGVGLLLWSIALIGRQVTAPTVCEA